MCSHSINHWEVNIMLKKFFVAAILALFMLSSQITFAANNYYDWSKVTQISSKSELAHYLESQSRAGQTVIPVVLTNGLSIPIQEAIIICPGSRLMQEIVSSDGQTTLIVYTLKEYPGTRVANAYLSGDTGWLLQDELKLYNVAVGIVNKICNEDKYLEDRAMSIYQEIMNRTSFVSSDDMSHQPRFVTAIGALIDGKANCQGYSDAFYMLGRMCGLDVGRMSGTTNNGPHMWNTVRYQPQGSVYFVDVTLGEQQVQHEDKYYPGYIYFNAPVEIMQVTHQWDPSLAPPNLQPDVDYEYSYSKWWQGSLARTTSAEAGLKLIGQKLSEGTKWFSVMTPYDERYSPANSERIVDYVKKNITKKMTFNVHWLRYGKYMFYTGRIV